MPIICFFGTDGSGKSTLAKDLAKRLNQDGFEVRLSWMRGTHTLASMLARLLSKSTAFKGPDNPYYGIAVHGNLKRLWQLLEFVSTLPIIPLRFILPSALGYRVVADRYVPDLVAWVSTTTCDWRYLERIKAKFLLALSSKANVKIYVTAILRSSLEGGRRIPPSLMNN